MFTPALIKMATNKIRGKWRKQGEHCKGWARETWAKRWPTEKLRDLNLFKMAANENWREMAQALGQRKSGQIDVMARGDTPPPYSLLPLSSSLWGLRSWVRRGCLSFRDVTLEIILG